MSHDPGYATSQAFGDDWLDEGQTAVLFVPSAVAQPVERNLLINPAHADFSRITHTPPQPVRWDHRFETALTIP